MPPYKDSAYIVGSYVEELRDLKEGQGYVFIIRSEGVTYKKNPELKEDRVLAQADNSLYQPYEILLIDILEIW